MAKARRRRAGKDNARPDGSGRQKGTPNHDYIIVYAVANQCPKCGSTERYAFRNKRCKTLSANDPRRPQFTHLVLRNCQCKKCLQWRNVRTYENIDGWDGVIACDETDEAI